ncbi:MAG: hypothetical protein ACOYN3_10185 [Acidimicrobiia bacterium]
MSALWIRSMPVDFWEAQTLRWLHNNLPLLESEGAISAALDTVSALAITAGNAAPLKWRATVLLRSQTTIMLARNLMRRDDSSQPPRMTRPHFALLFDACDFDAEQHAGRKSVLEHPAGARSITAGVNRIRHLALNEARTVLVMPHNFEETGVSYTIPVLSPGWTAALALAHIGEVHHHVGLGITPREKLVPGVLRSTEDLFGAYEAERLDVQRVFEHLGETATSDPSAWDGPHGFGIVFGLALQTLEGCTEQLTALDRLRQKSKLSARGVAQMLSVIDDVTHRLGLRFAPHLGFGR